MWDNPEGDELNLARNDCRCCKTILSSIDERTKEGCDHGMAAKLGQLTVYEVGKGQFLQKNLAK